LLQSILYKSCKVTHLMLAACWRFGILLPTGQVTLCIIRVILSNQTILFSFLLDAHLKLYFVAIVQHYKYETFSTRYLFIFFYVHLKLKAIHVFQFLSCVRLASFFSFNKLWFLCQLIRRVACWSIYCLRSRNTAPWIHVCVW
jgi:hypothetical protein